MFADHAPNAGITLADGGVVVHGFAWAVALVVTVAAMGGLLAVMGVILARRRRAQARRYAMRAFVYFSLVGPLLLFCGFWTVRSHDVACGPALSSLLSSPVPGTPVVSARTISDCRHAAGIQLAQGALIALLLTIAGAESLTASRRAHSGKTPHHLTHPASR